VIDDVLLPLYRQFAGLHRFEKVIVFPFSGAPVDTASGLLDYEALLAAADGESFVPAPHDENDPVAMCYTSGTTGRPKGVVYSHRSTVLHTLVGCLGENWSLKASDVLLPVTPMFHANCWGVPYGAVMTGTRIVFPGPHLHPDDLLDLMQLEPPTLSLGVPTIWLGLIQRFERALMELAVPVLAQRLVGQAGDDLLRREQAAGAIEQVIERQRHVHHRRLHGGSPRIQAVWSAPWLSRSATSAQYSGSSSDITMSESKPVPLRTLSRRHPSSTKPSLR